MQQYARNLGGALDHDDVDRMLRDLCPGVGPEDVAHFQARSVDSIDSVISLSPRQLTVNCLLSGADAPVPGSALPKMSCIVLLP